MLFRSQKHLSNDKDKEISRPKVDEQEEEKKLLELAKKVKPLEYGSKEDFQLTQALNHLKGLPVKLAERKEKDADAKSEKSEKSEKTDKSDKSHGNHSEPKKK